MSFHSISVPTPTNDIFLPLLTIGSQTYTATSNGAYVIGSQILTPGAPAINVSGTPIIWLLGLPTLSLVAVLRSCIQQIDPPYHHLQSPLKRTRRISTAPTWLMAKLSYQVRLPSLSRGLQSAWLQGLPMLWVVAAPSSNAVGRCHQSPSAPSFTMQTQTVHTPLVAKLQNQARP